MGLMYLISYGRAESKSVALWALSHAVAGNGVFIETFFFCSLSDFTNQHKIKHT